jgi:predicted esterase
MTYKKKKHKGLLIGLTLFLIVVGCVVLAFFIYVGSYYKATDHALSYLQDTERVDVSEEDDYISFVPKNQEATDCGFIFYPGGKVVTEAYAPLMASLADQGITSYILRMPFHLAFFATNAAEKVYSSNISNWYIGGHSLGGAAAASYVSDHTDLYKGFVLLASYSTEDMSSSSLKTLSLLGSNDKILNQDNYNKNKSHLANLTEVTISGGIHSYFGDYGHQDGDGIASISYEEQEQAIVDNVSSFILGKN